MSSFVKLICIFVILLENPPRGMKRNIGMKIIEPVHCKKYATHVNRPRISGILLILKRVIKQMLKLSWKITFFRSFLTVI